MPNSPYFKVKNIVSNKLFSWEVYYLNPGRSEQKHWHNGIEINYVSGKFYFQPKGKRHGAVNDSNKVLPVACIQIPGQLKELIESI